MDLWMDVDAALAEVPVNLMPLLDDSDFKTRETAVVFNQAGLDLVWNFVTTAGVMTQTAVTPTDTAGDYDWVNQGDGMYSIEIPASGGASINNDTEGFGWFTGFATGILPWRGPVIGFRAAALNNLLIDDAFSATRGLAGTALPAAAADAAGGLPISDAGGLDLDGRLGSDIPAILVDTSTTLQGELDGIQADTEDIQARLPAALTGGKMESNVGAVTAGVIAAASFAAGAFDAVWTVATRILTAATNITSTGGTTVPQTGDSFARLGAPAGASVSADIGVVDANVDTLLARITSTLFAGITSLAEWLGALAGKQTADTTARTEIRATGAGSGTFDETADSQEAIRDNQQTAAAAALTAYDPPTKAELDAAVAPLALEATAQDVLTDTAEIGAAGAGLTEAGGTGDQLTAVPWNAAWDAEVQSEVQDGIEVNHLDHLLAVTYDPAAKPGVADALLNELVESDAGVSRYTANALEQAPSGSAPTAGEVADAVWDETLAGHLGVGSTGEALNAAGAAGDPWVTALPGAYGAGSAGKIVGDNLNATVSSRATQATADDIEADTQDVQARLPAALVGGKMESNIGSITAGVIAAASFAAGAFDAVWTVASRTLTSFGTLTTDTATSVWAAGTRTLTAFDAAFKTGYALSSAGVQAIWDALTAALTAVGSVGKLIVDDLNATVGSRASQASLDALNDLSTADVKTQADQALVDVGLTTTITGRIDAAITSCASAVDLATVDGIADAIKLVTDALTEASATKLAASAGVIVLGTVDTTGFAPTTTEFEADDITEATADHYIGRVIIFRTGVLTFQATKITDYALSSGRAHFTVVALTEAAGNDDTFVIV
jgi:hypothetical protein